MQFTGWKSLKVMFNKFMSFEEKTECVALKIPFKSISYAIFNETSRFFRSRWMHWPFTQRIVRGRGGGRGWVSEASFATYWLFAVALIDFLFCAIY